MPIAGINDRTMFQLSIMNDPVKWRAALESGQLPKSEANFAHLANLENKAYQKQILDNQAAEAKDYYSNIGSNVNFQTELARRNVLNQLSKQRQGMMGSENQRGMIFSGRLRKGISDAQTQAGSNIAEAKQGIIKDVTNRAQELIARPLRGRAASDLSTIRMQQELDRIQQASDAAQNRQIGAGMGMIGTGVGTAYGSKK